MSYIEYSSTAISELNEISFGNNIYMKFEEHPTAPTGVILYFGDKKYENISQNLKTSRTATASQALEEYRKKSSPLTFPLSNKLHSNISKMNELSQKLNEKIEVLYEVEQSKGNDIFNCHVSFLGIQAMGVSKQKRKAQEIAFTNILDKISQKESKDVINNDPKEKLAKIVNTKEELTKIVDQKSTQSVEYCSRDYQDEIFNKGITSNVIICLGTGSGKTFIAVLLMKKYSETTRREYPLAKRIIFLVPTVALVYQQTNYIRKHTTFNVGNYCGGNSVNSWSNRWKEEVEKNHVLVMTPEIFRQLLQHNAVSMENLSMLIFDECHHGIHSGHPYNIIMTLYYHRHKSSNGNVPRVIGLTASPVFNVDINEHGNYHLLKKRVELLENVFDSKCITSIEYVHSLKSILSNPKIDIVLYKPENMDSLLIYNINQYIFQYRRKFETFCSNFKVHSTISPIMISLDDNGGGFVGHNNKIIITPESVKKKILKSFIDAKQVFQDIGMIGFVTYLKFLESGLTELLKRDIYCDYLDVFHKFLKYVRRMRDFAYIKLKEFMDLVKIKSLENFCDTLVISSKVSKLLNLLCKYYKLNRSQELHVESRVSAIVFTQKIITASILSSVLNELTAMESDNVGMGLRFSCNYAIGSASPDKLDKVLNGSVPMNHKLLNTRLQGFHRGNFDVLISTNVIEEGVDVKTCRLVIRFDKLVSLKSFIQSKGRIRNKDSNYYILGEEASYSEMKQQLANFQKAEGILEKILMDYCLEEAITLEEFNFYPDLPKDQQIFITSTSKIDMRRATTYLYRYCNTYIVQSKQLIKPIYTSETKNCKIRFCVRFPPEIDIDGIFYSFWLTNPGIAKRHCALNAIKYIHSKSLIDDNFLPVTPSSPALMSNTEDMNTQNTATNIDLKPNHFYKKSIPRYLKADLNSNTFYSYYIEFSQSNLRELGDKYFESLDLSVKNVGFLSPQSIPEFSIPLASTFNSLSVRLFAIDQKPIHISELQYKVIEEFNKTVYQDILDIVPKTCCWMPDSSYCTIWIILLNQKCQLNFDSMKQLIEFHKGAKESITGINLVATQNCEVVASRETAVIKNYSDDNTIYSVIGTISAKELSIIPDLSISYQQYYREKWNIAISDEELMLTCISVNKNIDMLQKLLSYQTLKTSVTHIPNNCISVHPLPYSILVKFKIMPSLIKRLIDFLNIYEWCENKLEVCGVEKICSDSLNSFIPNNFRDINQSICEEESLIISTFDDVYALLDKYWGGQEVNIIEFKSLVKSFTIGSCNECCEYERMALLGNVFIDLITTMFLFATLPIHGEAKLTKQRNILASNSASCDTGKMLGIQNIINAKPAKFGYNWCPPGYYLAEEKFDVSANDVIMYQYISDSSIAEVVKSLIGCILIHSNMRNTYNLTCKLNLISTINICDNFNSLEKLVSAVSQSNFYHPNLNEISHDIDSIEKILGYHFKNRQSVAEAITHVSSIVHREQIGYDRLKSIGDALIRFLITLYLYISKEEWRNRSLSHFDISNFQNALINDNLLAIISTKLGLVKSVQLQNYDIHNLLSQFFTTVESLDELNNIVEVPFIGIVCEKTCKASNGPTDSYVMEAISIPKLPSDVFKSIAGAVFVDCGCDLVLLATKFLPLFKPYIELYLKTLPIPPSVFVSENVLNFEKSTTKHDSDRFKTILTPYDQNIEYVGIAQTMEDAYVTACCCLMKHVQNERSKTNQIY